MLSFLATGAHSSRVFSQFECALIDIAARASGGERDFADRVLDRHAVERLAQHVVDIGVGSFLFRRRRDHDDDLAARLAALRIIMRQSRQIAAPDFLVQLGQFAADGRFAARLGLAARSASEAASRGPLSNSTKVAGMDAKLGDALLPRALLGRQEALEEKPVGRQPGERQRASARPTRPAAR